MKRFLGRFAVFLVVLLAVLGTVVVSRYSFAHLLPARHIGWSGFISQPDTNIAFVGSSQTRQGIDPKAFERYGCRAYVLAYNGLSPVFARAIVRASLEPLRAATWVIEAGPHFLLRRPSLQDTRLYLQLPPDGKSEVLAAVAQDPGADWRDLLTLLVRSDNELILTWPLVRPALERVAYRGGTTGLRRHGMSRKRFTEIELPRDIAGLSQADPNPEQVRAIEDIIELIQDAGSRAVFFEMPMPTPLEDHPLTQSGSALFRDLVAARGAEYVRGSEMLDISSPSNFSDATHLSSSGRSVLSQALAARLGAARHLAPCFHQRGAG